MNIEAILDLYKTAKNNIMVYVFALFFILYNKSFFKKM